MKQVELLKTHEVRTSLKNLHKHFHPTKEQEDVFEFMEYYIAAYPPVIRNETYAPKKVSGFMYIAVE